MITHEKRFTRSYWNDYFKKKYITLYNTKDY